MQKLLEKNILMVSKTSKLLKMSLKNIEQTITLINLKSSENLKNKLGNVNNNKKHVDVVNKPSVNQQIKVK